MSGSVDTVTWNGEGYGIPFPNVGSDSERDCVLRNPLWEMTSWTLPMDRRWTCQPPPPPATTGHGGSVRKELTLTELLLYTKLDALIQLPFFFFF